MLYDEQLLERYAMQAEQMTKEVGEPLRGIQIDDVSKALSLSINDGREIASFMQDLGWARCNYGPASPRLTLTPLGYREIAKLKRPRWRRWIDKHTILVSVVASVVANLIVQAIVRAIWG